MKTLFSTMFCLLMLASLSSCGDKKSSDGSPQSDSLSVTFDTKMFEGEYIGNFGDAHIVVVLSYVQGKNVSGYNIHKGLKRNIKGNLTTTNDVYRFKLEEPGDNPYDGKFDFTLEPEKFTGKGTWTPNDKKKLTAKSFELQQRIRDTTESDFIGFWDGAEMMEIKLDGFAELSYWDEVKNEGEISQKHVIRGQWIVEKETITIEWSNNPYNHGEKYVLVYSQDEDGAKTLVDEAKKHEFYQYYY